MEEIDEAFNWLILILGTLAATLIQSIHLYPSPWELTLKVQIQFLILLFVPLIVLVISWLSSHLAQNSEVRIVLKSFSWIYALLLLLVDLIFFLSVILQYHLSGTLLVVVLLWVPSLIYLASIRRRYILIFPNSKFLNSNKTQVFFCIIVTLMLTLQLIFTAPLTP